MLLSSFTKTSIEAGVDEVGRGCLAGPVVAAAVILPKDYFHPKLTDSKLLSLKDREVIKLDIQNNAISYAIGQVSHQEIDKINILQASFKAMHIAIAQLTMVPELLLIDGNRFANYPFVPHQCIIKGDAKFFSIAAASVLAKCFRDDLMSELALQYPEYGWQTNVGYPTIAHRKAIKKHGVTPWHRLSFRLLKE